MIITGNTFKYLAQVYRDLLFLLNKAVDIVELQPINELAQLQGLSRITETTVSNLGELIKDTRNYYEELKSFYEEGLFRKPPYSFSYLENFPAYRNQAINGLKLLHERSLSADSEDKTIISNFINSLLNAINELLLIVRYALKDSAADIEKGRLKPITSSDFVTTGDNHTL